MSLASGIGNLPPGVTDNDPHFGTDEPCEHKELSHGYCEDCGELIDEDAAAEWADDRAQEDGEQFRGGEYATFIAEQQAWIQRNLK